MEGTFAVNANSSRYRQWVVRTELFNELTVAGSSSAGGNDEIKWALFRPVSLQANFYRHK